MNCLADQVNDAKRTLEKELLALVRKYEIETGFCITCIVLDAATRDKPLNCTRTIKLHVCHGIERNSIPIAYK